MIKPGWARKATPQRRFKCGGDLVSCMNSECHKGLCSDCSAEIHECHERERTILMLRIGMPGLTVAFHQRLITFSRPDLDFSQPPCLSARMLISTSHPSMLRRKAKDTEACNIQSYAASRFPHVVSGLMAGLDVFAKAGSRNMLCFARSNSLIFDLHLCRFK